MTFILKFYFLYGLKMNLHKGDLCRLIKYMPYIYSIIIQANLGLLDKLIQCMYNLGNVTHNQYWRAHLLQPALQEYLVPFSYNLLLVHICILSMDLILKVPVNIFSCRVITVQSVHQGSFCDACFEVLYEVNVFS